MWIFTVISILMLILWTGWLCAVSQCERGDVHTEDTKGKPFFVVIVMQIRSSSQPEFGESHNLLRVCGYLAILSWFGWNCFFSVLILWGFCVVCFFGVCFFFLNPHCSWKQIVIFGADKLKLENLNFQFLIIVLGKKCRKAAKLSFHWYSCELLICILPLLLLVTCCVSPTPFFCVALISAV